MNSNNIVGLTEEEVISSRKKFASNQSSKKSKNQIWLTLIEIVSEPMFIILVCASLIYFVLGEINERMIMVLAILFVSGISFFQENRSRNAVNSLKKLSSPHAKVLRNGSQQTILTEELVVGDIIYFEDGNLFDSSYADVNKAYGKWDANRAAQNGYQPFPFQAGKKDGLIPGFLEGLEKMNIGDKALLFIPSNLGYGAQGAGGVIPPNTNLVFELELLETAPGTPAVAK